MIKISYKELLSTLESILKKNGFNESDSKICAEIFTENTLVGVSSHGVNRFPDFIDLVKSKYINPSVTPIKENMFNAFEQWNGQYGAGPLNAKLMTERAIELSDEFGIGLIALKNSNHWMRPGYYAWEAANKGYVFICWTNTIPIMPPWGAKEPTVGNNPIVLGVPRSEGNIVLDMALSQYSYGKLSNYSRENKELPFFGGYDNEGKLTKNAKIISENYRTLPIGLWKGAGFSLLLDLIATILSGGKSTYNLSENSIDSGMSQIYIAINPNKFASKEILDISINEILEFYLGAERDGKEPLSYPGERIIKTKNANLLNGIEINDEIWEKVVSLKE